MLAFHNDPAIKDKYLARVHAHAQADEIVHGKYREDGKGCAVGCTIHSDDHAAYETELGIPRALARLEDRLFEGQSNEKAKTFPLRFLQAIRPGADLSKVVWQFLHWLLTQELGRDHPLVKAAVQQCAAVMASMINGETAPAAAWSAARSAESAESAARSAAAPPTRSAARSAAWLAARSAARSAAESAAYGRMADKLIELLAAA